MICSLFSIYVLCHLLYSFCNDIFTQKSAKQKGGGGEEGTMNNNENILFKNEWKISEIHTNNNNNEKWDKLS